MEKEKREGAQGKIASFLFRIEQSRGRGGRLAAAALAGDLGHGGGQGGGENGEGLERIRSPPSPWAGVAQGGGSSGGGGLRRRRLWAAALGSTGEGGRRLGRCVARCGAVGGYL